MDTKNPIVVLWGSFLLFLVGIFAGYFTLTIWQIYPSLPKINLFGSKAVSSDYQTLKNSHFGAGSGENLKLVKELGAHWIRFPMDIDSMGADPNKIDFTDLDRRVKVAEANKILLFGSFNRGGRHTPQYWPDAALFAKYFAAVVERYDGDGINDMPGLSYPIKNWEILNEAPASPNQDLVPQIYAYYLKESAKAFKKVCSDCLLSPGSIPGPLGQQFLEDTLSLDPGLSASFGFTNWHSYSAPFDGSQGEINFSDWLKKWGFANKEIWYTELIADSPSNIVKTFVYHFARGAKVEIFSEFYSTKNPGSLVSSNGSKTASFEAYKTLIKNLDFFTSVQTLKEEWTGGQQNFYLKSGQYKFMVNDRPVYVLWGDGSLPAEIHGQVTVTQIDGSKVTESTSKVTLSNTPIFVTQ